MKALQLHYTSCRRGQSGSAGFQIRALTDGIRPDEQREIERGGVYRPPRDTRQDPSAEEISRDFPRALRFYTLDSGRRAITRSSYVGRDYSGRWGNFFAHTLVLESGQLPTLWPIDLYEWEGWREGLSPEEDNEEAPPPLPSADLTDVTPADSFGFKELQEFLREEPGRRDLLARMGRAVLIGRAASRAVVIRDTPNNDLYWMACLQKIFPPQHAATLTSSTYQDDPRGCATINATTGETDFTFDEAERRFRFYEFDLTTGVHSEVPDAADDYPAVAARWMAEDPGRLQQLYEFLQLFDHREPEAALISAIHLFELSLGQGAAPGGEQLSQMIDFAARHATPEGRVRLLDVLGRAAELPGGLPRAEDYEPLLRFLTEGARATGRPEHRALAFRTWTLLVRHHLLEGGRGLATAETTWELLRRDAGAATELAAFLLAETIWSDPRLPRLSTKVLGFLLRVVWTCLELARRLPPWEQTETDLILAGLAQQTDLPGSARAALTVSGRSSEALLAVSRRLRDLCCAQAGQEKRRAATEIGRGLGQVLRAGEPAAAMSVRRHLESEQEWDLLFGEWLGLLNEPGDPIQTFSRYQKEILESFPRYAAASFHAVANTLLRRLSETQKTTISLEWLRSGDVDRFPENIAATCIASANLAVPLDPEGKEGQETAQLVSEAAQSRKIQLLPDRPLLREVWRAARTAKTSLSDLRLKQILGSVEKLPDDECAVFMEGFLAAALERAVNNDEHYQVLLNTAGERPALLVQPYLDFFKLKRKPLWSQSLHSALRFWLTFDSRKATGKLAQLEETGMRGLLLVLEQLGPADLGKIDSRLRQGQIKGKAADRWREMQEALEKRKHSPWNRLLRVFGRS